MNKRKKARAKKPRAKKRPIKLVGCDGMVGPRPVSEDRILQLTNDISEGYKTGTKEELRAAVSWWSLKHAEAYSRENTLAHSILHFAIESIKATKRGARSNHRLSNTEK